MKTGLFSRLNLEVWFQGFWTLDLSLCATLGMLNIVCILVPRFAIIVDSQYPSSRRVCGVSALFMYM